MSLLHLCLLLPRICRGVQGWGPSISTPTWPSALLFQNMHAGHRLGGSRCVSHNFSIKPGMDIFKVSMIFKKSFLSLNFISGILGQCQWLEMTG